LISLIALLNLTSAVLLPDRITPVPLLAVLTPPAIGIHNTQGTVSSLPIAGPFLLQIIVLVAEAVLAPSLRPHGLAVEAHFALLTALSSVSSLADTPLHLPTPVHRAGEGEVVAGSGEGTGAAETGGRRTGGGVAIEALYTPLAVLSLRVVLAVVAHTGNLSS